MTLEEAKTRLADLESKITGFDSLDKNDRRISYQNLADMRAEADRLRRDIQHAQGRPAIVIGTWTGTK